MNLLKTKKGQSDGSGSGMFVAGSKVHYYLIILLILIPVFVLFVFLSKGYVSSLANQPPFLVSDNKMARLTQICFIPDNSAKDYVQNVIDINKFDKDHLRNCFSKGEFENSLSIKSLDQSFKPKKISGIQQSSKDIEKRYVLVLDKNKKLHPGVLTIQ